MLTDKIIKEELNIGNKIKNSPGTILGIHGKYGIIVSTVRNYLAIEELQLESKRKMFWEGFCTGTKKSYWLYISVGLSVFYLVFLWKKANIKKIL